MEPLALVSNLIFYFVHYKVKMSEGLFIKVAELLGVKFMKKWWPVDGSYWNRLQKKPKLDTSKRWALEYMIHDSYEYTKIHVAGLISETIIFLLIMLTWRSYRLIWIYSGLAGIHLYAMMMHQYNRILGRRRLAKLPVELKSEEKYDPYEIKIIPAFGNKFWHRLAFQEGEYSFIKFGPYLPSKEHAQNLKTRIEKEFDRLDIAGKIDRAFLVMIWDQRNFLLELLKDKLE